MAYYSNKKLPYLEFMKKLFFLTALQKSLLLFELKLSSKNRNYFSQYVNIGHNFFDAKYLINLFKCNIYEYLFMGKGYPIQYLFFKIINLIHTSITNDQ